MSARIDVITAVLRDPAPVRALLAYELRGSVVQLLGPGTTDPTWTATPELLAEAVDAGLARAERKEKDIPVGTAEVKGTTSTAAAHALVLESDGLDLLGVCRCGRPIGRTPLARSVDGLVGVWEQHCAAQDTAWADALTALPNTHPIGAS